MGCSIFGDAAFCGDACTSSSFCCFCFCSSSSVCSREQRLYGRSTTSSPRTHTLQCAENCERPEMTGAHLGCKLLESCLDIHQLSVVLARLRRPVDGAIGRTRVGSKVEQNSMNTPHTDTRKQESIFEQEHTASHMLGKAWRFVARLRQVVACLLLTRTCTKACEGGGRGRARVSAMQVQRTWKSLRRREDTAQACNLGFVSCQQAKRVRQAVLRAAAARPVVRRS